MAKKNWYAMKALQVDGETVAEIRIYEEIGFWGMTASQFMKQLDEVTQDAVRIVVSINSPGGNVFDAFAIYNALRRHKLPVDARVDGVAASAASLILMAGDRIIMPENAMIMIHNAWMGAVGTADELRTMADMMDKAGDGIVAAYVGKSGQSEERVQEMMNETTWMTALEAQALGFCDLIEEPVKLAASMRAVDLLAKHKGAPQDLLTALRDGEPDAAPQSDPDPAPKTTPDPAAQPKPAATLSASELTRHVITACKAKGIAHLSSSIMLGPDFATKEQADVRIEEALEINGLCDTAKLPEKAEDFIITGLGVEAVRARLFEHVVQSSAGTISNLQRPDDSPNPRAVSINPSAIYGARAAARHFR